jgi:lipopolysaccharide transport system ATP-binding protein
MSSPIISVEHLSKKYRITHQGQRQQYETLRDVLAAKSKNMLARLKPGKAGHSNGLSARSTNEDFWALKDVSFEVQPGEVLGIIGRNGAGKSTLLKILSRITDPTEGRVTIRGRVASLLEVGTGFHQELTGRENVFLNGAILGMSHAEIKRKFDEIVDFAGVEKFLDTPVKRYSSGMYVRLAFAVAAHLEPEILIVDEVLAVGDTEFQKKCLGKMRDVSTKEGRTVLFVSHNLQTVRQLCRQIVVLERGQVAFSGEVSAGVNRYIGTDSGDHTAAHDLLNYPRSAPPDGARLLRVELLDQDGNPAFQVQQSSNLTVVVHFRAERFIEALDLPMAVVHVEGQRIFSEVYSDQFETIDLSPGDYEIQFSIPLTFLKLDSYFLTVGLLEQGRVCDLVEGLPLPQLIDADANPHTESHRWGLVRIPVCWTHITTLTAVI